MRILRLDLIRLKRMTLLGPYRVSIQTGNGCVFYLCGDIEVTQLVWNGFALIRDLLFDDDHPHVGLEKRRFAQIADTANEV